MKLKIFFSLLSGTLCGLSFNHPWLAPLAWICLVPLFFVIDRSRGKSLLFYGFINFLAYFITAIFWLGHVSKLGLAVLLIYLSLYGAAFAFFSGIFLRRPYSLINIPSLWVILEALREHVWTGFGWAILGYSQYSAGMLIQSADIWGVKFISWLIVAVNLAVYRIIKSGRLMLKEVLVIVLIFSCSITYSWFRMNNLDQDGRVKVSLIQPNIAQEMKWDPGAADFITRKLGLLGNMAPADSLLVYPEASYPFVVEVGDYDELTEFSKGLGRNALIGFIAREKGKFFNEAALFNARGGLEDKYRKLKLIPFGEYVPLRKLFSFVSILDMVGDVSPGTGKVFFEYKDKIFSVLICFEDLFPGLVSGFAGSSDFIAAITNDAWFHGEPQASQHLGILVFRAIENRIPIVRAANTGLSGFISFTGKVHAFEKNNKKNFVEGVYTRHMKLSGERGLYTRFPDIFVVLCVLSLVILSGKVFPAGRPGNKKRGGVFNGITIRNSKSK